LLPPDPGVWKLSASLTGTQFHIEHIADDEPENPQPYWHVQDRLFTDLDLAIARGLRPNLGFDVHLPLRLVRERVRYEDLARQAYTPPVPGLHHRNETLTGIGDPQIGLDFGHPVSQWALGARIGLSIPLGLTQPNPFELGRLGLWHEHIQFGTGTWDPILSLGAGRPVGPLDVQVTGNARLATGRNEHGYRAGNRYSALLSAGLGVGKGWTANTGLALLREEAEHWNGRLESEGNLGRTDLLMSLGGSRVVPSVGSLSLNVQFPLASRSTGEQVEIPVIFSLSWGK
jgi:hypothetical protein